MRKITALIAFFALCLSAYAAVDYNNTNLRNKISQMIIIGFDGTKLEKNSALYDDLANERISGVILFSNSPKDSKSIKNVKNPKQLKKLISDIKAASKSKLFISIDEEGGKISRLPQERGFRAQTLSYKELGDKNDEMTTYLEAKKIAMTLKDLGINLNFAPCIDLALNPNSDVIFKAERSFSDDPQKVIKHANAYILAHNQYGILTALKHFPGHGSASGDSHLGFVDATNTFSSKELEPYQALISSGAAQNIMVSHVFNKKIDDKYPATLSYKTINGILKGKLGFSGLIITDDMQMKAITDNYTFEQAVINAINAGCDILVFGNNLEYGGKDLAQKFNDTVFNAVKDGKISPERIDEAYYKISTVKARLN